ncbi:carbonic anhydrase [Thermocoleostomius sinensis]|uniref:Carbonic anhydrase n=1 Tax=Thermocoleostomius sinensis A174 TaxID=2016057 RepID=A0A9E8ZDC1_9CYAN|nr:carbonic anhydrase [Thermocoleostomius sinensis]WAL59819.1 carbonic anhydrase [Thermocoleostomius sinensis A174]
MNYINHFIHRRDFLKIGSIGAFGFATTVSGWLWQQKSAQAADLSAIGLPSLSPDEALQKLMAGNQRFAQHHPQHPDQTEVRVREVAQAQHPFATVLSCADSRVSAEIVFDQGIGDIFDVRIAGNIATSAAIGSIEYAVALLETPLLMVLGHERCGAVTAAVQNQPLPGEIGTFVKAILPAVDRVKDQPGDAIDNAVTANVRYQMEQLQRSSLVSERIQSGQLKLVGGRYDLDSGIVTLVA